LISLSNFEKLAALLSTAKTIFNHFGMSTTLRM